MPIVFTSLHHLQKNVGFLSNTTISFSGDALYQQCNFEGALIYYERGMQSCSEAEQKKHFYIGKRRATESIRNVRNCGKKFAKSGALLIRGCFYFKYRKRTVVGVRKFQT